jgi:hypothetical protein
MKRIVTVLSVLFVALALCLAGGDALAGKKGRKGRKVAKLMTFKGEVVKQASKKGRVIGIRLKGEDGKIYRVYLNAKGKRMAKELHGKKAVVSAALIRKGSRKKPILWLNVKSYKPVEEPKPEPAAEEEGADAGEEYEDIP